jgi:hypothetical protein
MLMTTAASIPANTYSSVSPVLLRAARRPLEGRLWMDGG